MITVVTKGYKATIETYIPPLLYSVPCHHSVRSVIAVHKVISHSFAHSLMYSGCENRHPARRVERRSGDKVGKEIGTRSSSVLGGGRLARYRVKGKGCLFIGRRSTTVVCGYEACAVNT